MVQLWAGPAPVVGLLPEPLGANLHAAAAGLAAARPVGPLAELAVGRAGDDARLLDVPWRDETTAGWTQAQRRPSFSPTSERCGATSRRRCCRGLAASGSGFDLLLGTSRFNPNAPFEFHTMK